MTIREISFSVVIPAYNASATIQEAIVSCAGQTHPPAEIIVIDDASTDDTVERIKALNIPNLHLIQMIENGGSSVARNKGLDSATGTYIAFQDADDIWHEQKLEILDSIISSKPDIDFIYHPFTQQAMDTVKIPEGATIYRIPFIKLLQRNTIGTPCVVLRNDKKFRFEPSMRYMEDYDLWLRIGYKRKIYFIDVPLTQIRRPVLSKGGVSGNKWKMRKGEMKAFRRLMKLNPLFIILMPILYVNSMGKHLFKMISGK